MYRINPLEVLLAYKVQTSIESIPLDIYVHLSIEYSDVVCCQTRNTSKYSIHLPLIKQRLKKFDELGEILNLH